MHPEKRCIVPLGHAPANRLSSVSEPATESDMQHERPVVLTIAGHDPGGGAGQQADIEVIRAMGCHPASVLTCLTIQDTHDVHDVRPVEPSWVRRQAEAVLADLPVAVIKIGALGSAAVANTVADLLGERSPRLPVVLDPVLAASGGGRLSTDPVAGVLRERLLPLATIATPNIPEARELCGAAPDLDSCGRELLALGCEYALITGADEGEGDVLNRLYGEGRLLQVERWPRLPGRYHGSGCTLASALAALMARGMAPGDASQEAQRYVWDTLEAGYRPGDGQLLPDRFFWAAEYET